MKQNNSYILYAIIIVCIFSTFVHAWVPITSRVWVFLLLGCVLSLIEVPSYFRSRQFFLLLVYFVILLLNFLLGDSYFNSLPKVLVESASMIFATSLLMYSFRNNEYRVYYTFVVTFIIILVVAAFGTFLATRIEPDAVRMSADSIYESSYEKSLVSSFFQIGMTNYSLPHALPVIIPAFIIGIRNRSLHRLLRLLCIVGLVSDIVVIWLSGSTTSLLLAAIIFVLSFLTPKGSVKKHRKWIFGVTYCVGFLFLFKETIGDLFMSLSNVVEGNNNSFSLRFQEVGYYLQTGQSYGDFEMRSDRYATSIGELFQSPLLGTNARLGGHSALLDRFGTLGVVGIIPWIAAIYSSIKYAAKKLPSNVMLFYLEGIVAGILMLLSKNMATVEMWFCLFVALPLFLVFFSGKTSK